MTRSIPSFNSLLGGHATTVNHAISLASACTDLPESQVGTRLALAQLAQEEVGKSFSLLSAFSLPPDQKVWKRFWREFRDHDLKSARAFFYEWFEPTRISITLADGSVPDGFSRFERMSHEKNSGLYVDYDESLDEFVAPADRVQPADAAIRMMSVVNLAQKAWSLHTILTERDVEFSVREWSKLALRLCTTWTYQQEMPALLDTFAQQSDRHRELRERVDEGLRLTANALKNLVKSKEPGKDA